MEWFYIYRRRGKGIATELGRTRYLEDAQSILKNWADGYIVRQGKIIEEKSFE